MTAETAHVHFQSGKKHDVVDAHLAEQLEGSIARQDVQAMLAQHYTCQDEADDVGDVQPAQDNGCEQDDKEHDEEYPRRMCDERCHCGCKSSEKV